jgi:IPT/TIG domain
MNRNSKRIGALIAAFCICLISMPIPPVEAAVPVNVTVGKPSVWTLAQAHYLLAQMHKDDRAWKMVALGDLDPNGINRQRIEVLQSLLGISADFDAGATMKNRLLEQRYETNFNRQQMVRTELDRRNNDLIQGDRELYYINADLNRLSTADPKDDNAIKAKTAERDAKTVERDAINTRITALNSELTALGSENISNNVPSLTAPFSASPQPAASPLTPKLSNLIDKSFLDKVFTDTANKSSQLQASMRLDNYIQMQYEVISKQLTLLRDEVGEDQRVIFLELPSSIYSVPKKADDYLAQVRWKVTGYYPESAPSPTPTPMPTPTETPASTENPYERNTRLLARELGISTQATGNRYASSGEVKYQSATPDSVRTVDIIPRQSALNVNAVHDTSKGFALSARFLATFGLGGKVDYQRQREVYDQFVYQDIFASGFGKGSNEFGWTFGPLPGTKTLAPGIRTTYAVLVIPSYARKIQITGDGYMFRRGNPQPDSADIPQSTQTFQIDIPGEDTNGFFVDSADYSAVQSGKRVSLILGGPYFSPQVGVLVNGVALERVVALSPIDQPTPPVPSGSPGGTSSAGQYEYVNSHRMVASFSMGDSYEGTPVIALVTPEKTSIINRYRIQVNNSRGDDSLEKHGLLEPMFIAPLAISKVQFIDRWLAGGRTYVRAVISGKGFRPGASVSVNGEPIDNSSMVNLTNGTPVYPVEQKSTHEYDIVFEDRGVPSWDLTFRQGSTQGQEETSYQVARPLAPRITYDILRYTPRQDKRPARLDMRLSGSEFQRITQVSMLKDGVLSAPWLCTVPGALPPAPVVVPSNSRGRKRTKPTPAPIDPPTGRCTVVSAGEVLVTIPLPTTDHNDAILLVVAADKGESAILNVLPPAAPTITSIVNDVTNKAEGPIDGGYVVVIRGENLEQVERVFFGNKPAEIRQSAPGVLTVMVPKGDEGTVRVLLETNTPYQNKFLSNSQDFTDTAQKKALFTYTKPKS